MSDLAARRPILVLGIARRSGTNFLGSVLECHADCAVPGPPLVEDHLLRDAHLLRRYAERTARRWPPRWGPRDAERQALARELGRGLERFLQQRAPGRRVIARTPSLDNLALAARLVPGADIVVLVRDGRDVAASLMAGFGLPFDAAVLEWRRGARSLLRAAAATRLMVVRYEALVTQFDDEVVALLRALGLDEARYDWGRARALPVVGSSYTGRRRVTWDPAAVPLPPGPRHETWRPRQHDRFSWLAGAEQQALGYPLPSPAAGSRAHLARNLARNLAADVARPVRMVPGRPLVALVRGRVAGVVRRRS